MSATPAFLRASGVLMHPTALPGPYGVGDLGASARSFVDFLVSAEQQLWQVLPLGPPCEGEWCPYSAFSALAGNPMLISVEDLAEMGLVTASELRESTLPTSERVDFGRVEQKKREVLSRAFARFTHQHPLREQHDSFCERNASWLDDDALFASLRAARPGRRWSSWEDDLARREPSALARAREAMTTEIARHKFLQFVFAQQWASLRRYANERGVKLVGDVPIYVAHDSVDAWAHPDAFQLDAATGEPRWVAGAAPDNFFTEEGQIWGNPVYDWSWHRRQDYRWWSERFRVYLEAFDFVRVDHFRGFEAFWAIPPTAKSARAGHWEPGPGAEFFEAMRRDHGSLPILVEDLGYITPEVHALRDRFGLPGMMVMLFGFNGDSGNIHLPHAANDRHVVYTSTHDTDTVRGWFDHLPVARQQEVLRYAGGSAEGIPWRFIELAYASEALWAIVPLQDLLELGSEGRFNVPGERLDANWSWRTREGAWSPALAERLRLLTRASRRQGLVRAEASGSGHVS